jgi:hypothetical protein
VSAFSPIELATLLFTVSLLSLLVLATTAGTRQNAGAIRCLNNHRQLALAWRMYAEDNRGKLACNRDGGNAGKSAADASWVGGWLDYTANQDNTNVSLLIDHNQWPYGAYFGPYIRSASVFKCPADPSMAHVAPGKLLPRVRSVSMNNYMGQKSRTWTTPSSYSLYGNIEQIGAPSQLFVIMDERADSINEGCFMTNPDTRWNIIDYPGNYHEGAGTFSFADSHVELHKWKDRRTTPTLIPDVLIPLNRTILNDVDIDWLDEHTSQLK